APDSGKYVSKGAGNDGNTGKKGAVHIVEHVGNPTQAVSGNGDNMQRASNLPYWLTSLGFMPSHDMLEKVMEFTSEHIIIGVFWNSDGFVSNLSKEQILPFIAISETNL
ncbi:hypothetical protein ACJX0J_030593, partial [Zea mays]